MVQPSNIIAMKKYILLLPIFLLLCFYPKLLKAQTLPLASPHDLNHWQVDLKKINEFESNINKAILLKEFSGAQYVLSKNGKIVSRKNFGEMDIQTHVPMNYEAVFRLASMTKPIATLALLLLQEDGKVNVNEPLAKYLPEYNQPTVLVSQDSISGMRIFKVTDAKQPILIKHLLTHSAGFASNYGGTMGSTYIEVFKDQYDHDLNYFSEKLSKLPLNHQPGEGWIYGPSINIIGLLVEKISGMAFQDFVEKRITKPLGMKDTKFYLDESYANRLTTLYMRNAQNELEIRDPGNINSSKISGKKLFFSGSGGLHATMDDYLTFCQMILNDGTFNGTQIAKKETIALMKTDQLPLELDGGLIQDPNKSNGFTFGYQIKRKNRANDLSPNGTISWGGATGPVFFIDPIDQIIGIMMIQVQPYSHSKIRYDFKNWMMQSMGIKN